MPAFWLSETPQTRQMTLMMTLLRAVGLFVKNAVATKPDTDENDDDELEDGKETDCENRHDDFE